jgi:D-sedoheptulose 7-phosphate isomerase
MQKQQLNNVHSKFFNTYLSNFSELILLQKILIGKLSQIKKIFEEVKKKNKKIMIFGNGGSASIANHFSTDITNINKIRCVNFNESNFITCLANDYGYQNWVKKSIQYHGDKGDVLIVISSSGNSKNIINACLEARKKKFSTIITFTGFSSLNKVKKLGDINIWINSRNYNFVENIHQILLLSVVDSIKDN